MKKLNHFTNFFSKKISIDTYAGLTGQNLILPFYHTVYRIEKPHFFDFGYVRSDRQFIDDLEFFSSNYQSVPVQKINSENRSFHITFDDGMAEMFSVVMPLLLEKKIHATFFVNLDFVDNKMMFLPHKINVVRHQINNSEYLRKCLSEFLQVPEQKISQALLKIQSHEVIDKIAGVINLDFKDYLRENSPYLTSKQLTNLQKAGFTVGNHGKSHKNFNLLNFNEQKKELIEVNTFLKDLEIEDLYFAFPYGDHKIGNEFFDWMYSEGSVLKSFGVSGMKKDSYSKHYHRILMEHNELTAEEIIKFEYFYYLLKNIFNRNIIKR